MKSKDFLSRNKKNGFFFSSVFLRGLGYGKKMFPMFWSVRALYFFRDSKDILKRLDFKYVKNPKYLSLKQHLKYHILEYCVIYHCWAERM